MDISSIIDPHDRPPHPHPNHTPRLPNYQTLNRSCTSRSAFSRYSDGPSCPFASTFHRSPGYKSNRGHEPPTRTSPRLQTNPLPALPILNYERDDCDEDDDIDPEGHSDHHFSRSLAAVDDDFEDLEDVFDHEDLPEELEWDDLSAFSSVNLSESELSATDSPSSSSSQPGSQSISDPVTHTSTQTSRALATAPTSYMASIDLTREPDSPPPSISTRSSARGPKRTRRISTDCAGPSQAKRRRTNNGSAVKAEELEKKPPPPLEVIDLAEADNDDSLQEILKKQRAEQVQAQADIADEKKGKGTRLTLMNCTVCLENPTDLTATSCGHAFCRACLMNWLTPNSKREGPSRPNCPACRTAITKKGKGYNVVHLEIMKRANKRPPKGK